MKKAMRCSRVASPDRSTWKAGEEAGGHPKDSNASPQVRRRRKTCRGQDGTASRAARGNHRSSFTFCSSAVAAANSAKAGSALRAL